MGYGGALKSGFKSSKYDLIFIPMETVSMISASLSY